MRVVEGVAAVDDLDAFVERLGEIGARRDCAVQAFDARHVVGRDHLRRAVELADRSIARGENVARDRAIEILLYAAGRRQIDRALTMGVSEGETPAVVLVAADREADAADADLADREADAADAVADLPALSPGETLGEFDEERVREFFDVTARESAATEGTVADAVLERVALLDVEK